jgi:hypothetical protein
MLPKKVLCDLEIPFIQVYNIPVYLKRYDILYASSFFQLHNSFEVIFNYTRKTKKIPTVRWGSSKRKRIGLLE